jgi:hypothetical protein
MGQCISSTKAVVEEATRTLSEKAEEAKAYVETYNARRYHPVSTENTTSIDTNKRTYDSPVFSLVEGEDEIDKIFEMNINENI